MSFHPFRYFRKHQKTLLACVTIMAMFTFVLCSGLGGYGDLNAANAFDATNRSHSTRAMIAGPFLFMPSRTDLPPGIATARVMDFTLPREKECTLPLSRLRSARN